MGGFDFFSVLSKSGIMLILIVFIGAINESSINSLIDGFSIDSSQMKALVVNVTLFVFLLGVFLIPSLRENVMKLINKPFEYANKALDTFMK